MGLESQTGLFSGHCIGELIVEHESLLGRMLKPNNLVYEVRPLTQDVLGINHNVGDTINNTEVGFRPKENLWSFQEFVRPFLDCFFKVSIHSIHPLLLVLSIGKRM